ncbi:hypothetical protein HanIR_Chr13g0658551 [Helianthus annuus]|nr:hypothetical protein HanIR_Chr13g0658551 [Helianthus annuus]
MNVWSSSSLNLFCIAHRTQHLSPLHLGLLLILTKRNMEILNLPHTSDLTLFFLLIAESH